MCVSLITTVGAALGECIDNTGVEFGGVDARESNFLAEVFGEEFEEVAVAVRVQARGVEKGGFFVVDFGIRVVGYGEFEVEGWGKGKEKTGSR